ncbi:hypothetical protein SAMN05216577_10134 [Pseudomonas citronellolis]|uniref:General secretion pathway protein GspK n=1 Tax=Pseudomonas citronellolis TaxID=53408 RepID=A0AAQ1KDI4_9PSED|nr:MULTISPECIES: hypothetical protein [Pseudomonas]MCL6691840.1 hypothetical protein [Pseudomonas sp. R3.Fl]MCP1605141.1 hypothetical protein [Pseudomonas citronellolis]MCP1642713.1 hypothetical protein [Pseudomonas citronellolis]MCP1655989.1 hypothetical protein [Pseudomonas citronellolis]MCP1665637.1 hypothetical protein [Pseudomonas citronellolis]
MRTERGFVLVGVIWFLAIMTLVVASAVTWIERSLDGIEKERQGLLRDMTERSMLSRLTWLASTQRLTLAGLTTPDSPAPSLADMDMSVLPVGAELALDGREYCLANGWCFAFVDRASRLGLEQAPPAALASLLEGLGIAPERIAPMLAELAGHLRGPPGSAVLRSLHAPQEVFVLDSWRPWEAALRAAGWEELVTVGEPSLNVNTASGQLLRLAWRLPEDSLALLLAARHERPLRGVGDLEGVLGMYLQQLPAENWSRLASATLFIRLRPADAVARYEYQLRFESDDLQGSPWQFLQRRSLPRNVPITDTAPIHHEAPGLLSAPLVASP